MARDVAGVGTSGVREVRCGIGKLWIPFLGTREIPQFTSTRRTTRAKTVRSAIKPAPSPFDAATD